MLFILFGSAAAATVLAAIALSHYADELSEKTSIGGLLVGTVLLAGATSLPEVTTSLSAVFIGNPDIAIGNMLGSNMFNLCIIACFDLYYRRIRLYQSVSSAHKYTAGLGFVLSLMILLALIRQSGYVVYWVGIDSLFIALICILGMYILGRIAGTLEDEADISLSESGQNIVFSFKKTFLGFALMALLITGSGTMLSFAGDEIAELTGVGSSFVGSFLLAATTSIPEATAVLVALRLKNVNLALGSILGSNIFNMLILAGSDAFYRQGPILSNVSPVLYTASISVCMLSTILLAAIVRKKKTSTFWYILPSLLIVGGYLYSFYLIFQGLTIF